MGFYCYYNSEELSNKEHLEFLSGHLQKCGINTKGSCDANCCFTFHQVGCPEFSKHCIAIKEMECFLLDMSALLTLLTSLLEVLFQFPTFNGDLALQNDNDSSILLGSQ